MNDRKITSSEASAVVRGNLYCPICGYNLRGLAASNCPECGNAFDRAQLETSNLPWVFRRSYGNLRSYWKTVWLITVRQQRFFEEFQRPVDYRDAQSFRWMTIWHVVGTAAVLAAIVFLADSWNRLANTSALDVALASGMTVMILGCFVLFLLAVTGVPSYYFHPRQLPVEQQNRAIALSYYACGPLAWIPPILLIGSGAGFLGALISIRTNFEVAYVIVGLLMPLFPIVAWLFTLVRLARRCLPRSTASCVCFGLGLPALWFTLGILTLVLLPIMLLFPLMLVLCFI